MIYQIKNKNSDNKRVNVCWLDCSESDFLDISLLMYGTKEHYAHIHTDDTSNVDLHSNNLNPCVLTVSTKMPFGPVLSTNVVFAHLKSNATLQNLKNMVITVWYASSYNSVVANYLTLRGRHNVG